MSQAIHFIIAIAFVAYASAASIGWEPHMIGGNETTIQQHPYQASILAPGYVHVCSGAIYSARYIITAGHCIYRAPIYDVRISVGSTSFSSGTLYSANRIIIHSMFRPEPLYYDIGLIQTTRSILFSDTVKAIALNTDIIAITNATATGWGSTQSGSGPSQNLRLLNITTMENSVCKNMHVGTGMSNSIIDNVICANTTTTEGMCNGDAGGPMVVDEKLVGLVSWGIPCAKGYPDVYVRISSHVDWIIRNAI